MQKRKACTIKPVHLKDIKPTVSSKEDEGGTLETLQSDRLIVTMINPEVKLCLKTNPTWIRRDFPV